MEKVMTIAVVLVVIFALLAFAFMLGKNLLEMGEEPEEVSPEENKRLEDILEKKGKDGIVITNAPVIEYKIPNSEKIHRIAIRYAKTTIGSGKKNDIVIDHPTVESRHAEIYLAVKGAARYFNLKNKAKYNPVVLYCPQKEFLSQQSFMERAVKLCRKFFGDKDENPDSDYRIIKNSIPLLENKSNLFYFGDVKVNIKFEKSVYTPSPLNPSSEPLKSEPELVESEPLESDEDSVKNAKKAEKEFKYKVIRSTGSIGSINNDDLL